MKKALFPLALVVLLASLAACKKEAAPAAPPQTAPVDTSTPTWSPTPTPTSTITNTPIPTATATAVVTWCSVGNNSGTVGLSWQNAGSNIGANSTLFLRIQTGSAAVSLTHIQYYSYNTGKQLRVYLYGDNGTGSAPLSLLSFAWLEDNPGAFGWRSIDITDIYAPANTYYWLGISTGDGTDEATFGTCMGCGAVSRIAPGWGFDPYTSGTATSYAPSLLANWICAP